MQSYRSLANTNWPDQQQRIRHLKNRIVRLANVSGQPILVAGNEVRHQERSGDRLSVTAAKARALQWKRVNLSFDRDTHTVRFCKRTLNSLASTLLKTLSVGREGPILGGNTTEASTF